MTLQQLKYALTIADCGSMNEAGKTAFYLTAKSVRDDEGA